MTLPATKTIKCTFWKESDFYLYREKNIAQSKLGNINIFPNGVLPENVHFIVVVGAQSATTTTTKKAF